MGTGSSAGPSSGVVAVAFSSGAHYPWSRDVNLRDRAAGLGCGSVTAGPATSWQLPSVLVLAVVAGGLVLATTVGWQTGTRVLGLAFLLAAGLRLSLPARSAGWLVVRTRGLDAAVLLALGFAMVALAETIPPA